MAFAAILQHGFSSPTKLPPSPPGPVSHLGRPRLLDCRSGGRASRMSVCRAGRRRRGLLDWRKSLRPTPGAPLSTSQLPPGTSPANNEAGRLSASWWGQSWPARLGTGAGCPGEGGVGYGWASI